MMITKKALPRRTVLRGLGATLALPLLDAMVPAMSAQAKTAARPARRLGFVYVSNGLTMPHYLPKVGADESSFELSPILGPLAPFKEHLVVVTGLANSALDSQTGSGPHSRCGSAWLNGVSPKRTEGADISAATTIDQYAAVELGKETQLFSLELCVDPNHVGFNCDNGYSCVYQNTFCWRTPTTPLPMESNPRAVFERLFGDGGDAGSRRAQRQRGRSILDAVSDAMGRVQRTLGPADRTTVTEYLDAVRDVERRIQKSEDNTDDSILAGLEKPLTMPDSYDEHAKVMLDMQLLAFQSDVTRVVSLQLAREQSNRPYPWIGVPQGHHTVSHHQSVPEVMELNTKINTYHMSLFARLVEKMKNTPDGDGSLLDHSMLLYGCGMGDGDFHHPHNLPTVLVGGGSGALRGGRVVQAPTDTPMMNLGVTLLDKVGVDVKSIGDSTGRIVGL